MSVGPETSVLFLDDKEEGCVLTFGGVGASEMSTVSERKDF